MLKNTVLMKGIITAALMNISSLAWSADIWTGPSFAGSAATFNISMSGIPTSNQSTQVFGWLASGCPGVHNGNVFTLALTPYTFTPGTTVHADGTSIYNLLSGAFPGNIENVNSITVVPQHGDFSSLFTSTPCFEVQCSSMTGQCITTTGPQTVTLA